MGLDPLRDQIHRLRKSGNSRLIGAAIIASAILAAPAVPRFLPQSPSPDTSATAAPAPPGALARVAEALRAKGDAGADERGALSTLMRIARGVGKVASRADFILAVQNGFA